MKDNKTKIGFLVAALLTMGQATQAEPAKNESPQDGFAPIETLTPEHRFTLHPQIELLRKTIKIDWKSVVIGVNQKGELVLKGRETVKISDDVNPTCWAN